MNMHRPDPEARRVAVLVEDVETLREEVRQLRALLAPPIRLPIEWRLTLSEERLLSALRAAGPRTLTRERAIVAMCDREVDLPNSQILSVLASRIRAKLRLIGIENPIIAVAGEGYRLTPAGLAALKAALKREAGSPTPTDSPAHRAVTGGA